MFILNSDFPDATPDQKWHQFRLYKNRQLQMTDFTQTNDCEMSKTEVEKFKELRKAIRHAEKDFKYVEDIVLPGWFEIRDYKVVMVEKEYKVEKL